MAFPRASEFVAIGLGVFFLCLLATAVTWLNSRLQLVEAKIVQISQETLDTAREKAIARASQEFPEKEVPDESAVTSLREIGYTASTRRTKIDQFYRILNSTKRYGLFNRGTVEFLRIVNAAESGGIDRALDYLETIEAQMIALSSRTGKPSLRDYAAARTLMIAAACAAAEGRTTEAAVLFEKIVTLPVDKHAAIYEAGWFHIYNSHAELGLGLFSAAEESARTSFSLGEVLSRPEFSGEIDSLRIQSAARFQLGRISLTKDPTNSLEEAMDQFELALRNARLVIKKHPDKVTDLPYASNRFLESGDAFLAGGLDDDVERAIQSYAIAVKLRREHFDWDSGPDRRSDRMALTLEKLANAYQTRAKAGDIDLAIKLYEEALSFREKHYRSNPDSKESEHAEMGVRGILARLYWERSAPGDRERTLDQQFRRFESTKAEMLANPDRLTTEYVKKVRKQGNSSVDSENEAEVGYGIKLLESAAEFRRILDVREARDKAENPEAEWRPRDLPFILVKLGDTFKARGEDGDLELALSKHEEALEVWRNLHTEYPDEDVFKGDIASQLEQVADLLKAIGGPENLERAVELYTEELRISEEIHVRSPDSVRAARNFAAIHNKLAFGYNALGDEEARKKAHELHKEAARRQRGLLAEHPDRSDLPRDLAVSLSCVGDFLFQEGGEENNQLGLKANREAIALLRDLYKADSTNSAVARSLIAAHHDFWKYGEKAVGSDFAEKHGRTCYQLIVDSIDNGLVFDSDIMDVYDALSEEFGPHGEE